MTRKTLFLLALVLVLGMVNAQAAEHYVIDTKGMHAFVTFKIKHLGFSWLEGRFNRFSGDFDYDEAERDKHLRSERFFDAKKFPQATFVSTGWEDHGGGKATLNGEFTLRGVTKKIAIDVSQVGAGKDPWGGFRRGFEGTTNLNLSDYKMKEGHILGPVADNVQLWLSIEGVRQ
jgi:polyisoprenoid-binding protein YceI